MLLFYLYLKNILKNHLMQYKKPINFAIMYYIKINYSKDIIYDFFDKHVELVLSDYLNKKFITDE